MAEEKNEEQRLQEVLEGLVAKWQTLLRLDDWDISVEFATIRELSDCDADIFYDVCHAKAHMRVLHPDFADMVEHRLNDYDVEHSVVHELVHLRFVDSTRHDSKERFDIHEERAINIIAQALVDLGNVCYECELQKESNDECCQSKA